MATDARLSTSHLPNPHGYVSCTVVPQAPPLIPAQSLAGIIGLLHRVVAAQIARRRLAGPLIVLICSRLRRIAGRLADIAARLQAGRLRRRAASRRRPAQQPTRPCRKPPLPQGFAWLVRLVQETAGGASQLRHLLAQPEMADFIAAAPQSARPLRSLCWMLGIRPPPGLKPAGSAPAAVPDPPAAADPPAPAATPPGPPSPSRASPPLPPLLHLSGSGPPVQA